MVRSQLFNKKKSVFIFIKEKSIIEIPRIFFDIINKKKLKLTHLSITIKL